VTESGRITNAERSARWRKEHPDYQSGWYSKNKTRVIKYAKRYRKTHKERLEKCQVEYRKTHKKEARKYNAKKYYSIKAWLNANIEALDCADCELSFRGRPWLADFHHTGKRKRKGSIATLVKNSSYNHAVRELNSGVFVCPTCHRIRDRKNKT